MTPDEARERFSDAHEGTLARGEQYAFEQLLASDPELQKEYDAFVQVVQATSELGEEKDPDLEVDLLPGLQARLRAQSGGRFYRDRFAQSPIHRAVPLWIVSALVLIVVLCWFAFDAGLF